MTQGRIVPIDGHSRLKFANHMNAPWVEFSEADYSMVIVNTGAADTIMH